MRVPEVAWVVGFLSHKIGGGAIWAEADRPGAGNTLVIRLTRGEHRGGFWGRVSKHRRRAKFSEMRSSASDGKFFGMLCCPRCAWRIGKGQTWRESFVVRFEVFTKTKIRPLFGTIHAIPKNRNFLEVLWLVLVRFDENRLSRRQNFRKSEKKERTWC